MRDAILAALAYGILAVLCLAAAAIVAGHAFGYPLVAACDVNDDSVINSADLGQIAAALGEIGPGDTNADRRINSLDLGLCAQHFNQWRYPDDGGPDDAAAIATIDAQPAATQTAQVE